MTHEELVAKRARYRAIPFDAKKNAQSIRDTGKDLWGQSALLTRQQREARQVSA